MTEFLTTANRKLRFEPLDDGTLRTAGMRGGDTRLTVPEVVELVRDLLGWLLDQEHVKRPAVWGFYVRLCVWLVDQKAPEKPTGLGESAGGDVSLQRRRLPPTSPAKGAKP